MKIIITNSIIINDMKKYTNKILIITLSTLVLLNIIFLSVIIYNIKNKTTLYDMESPYENQSLRFSSDIPLINIQIEDETTDNDTILNENME